jgi:hypothetical protein
MPGENSFVITAEQKNLLEFNVQRLILQDDAEGGAIVDQPVGARGGQVGVETGGTKGDNAAACGFAGKDPGDGVFDDQAAGGRKFELCGAFQVWLGVGFAAPDVGGGDEIVDVGQKSGNCKANLGELVGGGGDDGEALRRSGGQYVPCAGQGDDVGEVFKFGSLHPLIFGLVSFGGGVWEKFLDAGQAGAPVGVGKDLRGIKIVACSPEGPDAFDGGSGIDEDAVHVKEQGLAEEGGQEGNYI